MLQKCCFPPALQVARSTQDVADKSPVEETSVREREKIYFETRMGG